MDITKASKLLHLGFRSILDTKDPTFSLTNNLAAAKTPSGGPPCEVVWSLIDFSQPLIHGELSPIIEMQIDINIYYSGPAITENGVTTAPQTLALGVYEAFRKKLHTSKSFSFGGGDGKTLVVLMSETQAMEQEKSDNTSRVISSFSMTIQDDDNE